MPTILHALLLMTSKANKLPLEIEPVAHANNTILALTMLKNKLGYKTFIILLSVKLLKLTLAETLESLFAYKPFKLLTQFYPGCFVTILAKKTFIVHHAD